MHRFFNLKGYNAGAESAVFKLFFTHLPLYAELIIMSFSAGWLILTVLFCP
jgi:hypothetical protein